MIFSDRKYNLTVTHPFRPSSTHLLLITYVITPFAPITSKVSEIVCLTNLSCRATISPKELCPRNYNGLWTNI